MGERDLEMKFLKNHPFIVGAKIYIRDGRHRLVNYLDGRRLTDKESKKLLIDSGKLLGVIISISEKLIPYSQLGKKKVRV